jgi:hypothetical protein
MWISVPPTREEEKKEYTSEEDVSNSEEDFKSEPGVEAAEVADEDEQGSAYYNTRVVTAFVHNSSAEALSAMGEPAAVQELVKLLDAVFGDSLASSSFVRGRMIDWSQEPFIEGGCVLAAVISAGALEDFCLTEHPQHVAIVAGTHRRRWDCTRERGKFSTTSRGACFSLLGSTRMCIVTQIFKVLWRPVDGQRRVYCNLWKNGKSLKTANQKRTRHMAFLPNTLQCKKWESTMHLVIAF